MRKSIWPAVLLALIGGFVDALGYLVLARLFTAHMSGNSAALGAYLGRGEWTKAWLRLMPIPAFALGGAAGATVVTFAHRLNLRAQLAPAFVLELLLLAGFQALFPSTWMAPGASPFTLWGLASLLSAAMGVQAATLRRVGRERVTTTFVSGMLIDTVEEGVAWAFEAKGTKARRERRTHALLFAAIYFSFLAGAVMGSASETRWGERALFAPMVALIIVAIEQEVRGRDAADSAPKLQGTKT